MHRLLVLTLFAALAAAQTGPPPTDPSSTTTPENSTVPNAVPTANTTTSAPASTAPAQTLPAPSQPNSPVSPASASQPAQGTGTTSNAMAITPTGKPVSPLTKKRPRPTTDLDAARAERQGPDALLDLPPLPEEKLSLIGGKVVRVDRVLERMEVQPFGEKKKTEFAFDIRTQVTRDGAKIPVKDIKPGDRVYADTQPDSQNRVFAKNIRVVTKQAAADTGHGQIVSYDASSGKLVIRDELVPQPVTLQLTRDTVIRKDQSAGSTADLQPGSLVSVSFIPGGNTVASQVTVLAVPGASFVFAGPVTHLDLSSHLLAVANQTDGKTYDIQFDPGKTGVKRDLREGSNVSVNATFDGHNYVANQVSVVPEGNASPKQE